MFSKIQVNGRSVVSFLLAVMMVGLATGPALAWFDEGDINGKPALPCRVIGNGPEAQTVYCHQATPGDTRVVVEQPLLRPAIARAEQMVMPGQGPADPIVQTASDQ